MSRRHRHATALTLSTAAVALCAAPSAYAGAMQLGLADRDGVPVLWVWGSDSADTVELGHVASEKITLTPGPGTTIALASAGAAPPCTESEGVWTCTLTGLGKWGPGSVTREQVGASLGAGDDRFAVAKGVLDSTVHGLVVLGESGNDAIIGRGELDAFHGGDGHDDLRPHGGADIADGGEGNDLLMTSGSEFGGNVSIPPDRDNAATTCGPGIDLVVRDRDTADDGIDLASCEKDAGEASLAQVKSDPDYGRWTYEPGMTVRTTWKSTRSVPDVVENTWETCAEPWRYGSNEAPNCAALTRTDELSITDALVGTSIRVASRAFYAIPDNPVGRWPAGERTTNAVLVQPFLGPMNIVPITKEENRAAVRDALLAALAPTTKPKPTFRLAKPGPTLSGDASTSTARIVASLRVDRTSLGQRGKGTTVVAKLDMSVTGKFSRPLKLNAAGKQLRTRLGRKGTAKATLRVWLQVGGNGPSASRTIAVKIKAR